MNAADLVGDLSQESYRRRMDALHDAEVDAYLMPSSLSRLL